MDRFSRPASLLTRPAVQRLVAFFVIAVIAASCSSTSTGSLLPAADQAPAAPAGVVVNDADDGLTIVSTPQDRGVLDGPVIYSTNTERDDPHKPEQTPIEETVETPVDEPHREAHEESRCETEFLSEDLTSNRGNSLPHGRLQVVVFYDGDPESSPELRIGVGADHEIVVGGERSGGSIETFGRAIETREYQLDACTPNGSFGVAGVVPNGVIDGLAFAAMWRDDDGRFHLVKSNTTAATSATYVGMWPLGFSGESFHERTPQITDPYGRETARGLIIGSALMPNGSYNFNVPA